MGPNFVSPAFKTNGRILGAALSSLIRNVRVKKYFATNCTTIDLDNSVENLLHTKVNKSLLLRQLQSRFEPSKTRSPIEHYLQTVSKRITQIALVKHNDNQKSLWAAYYYVARSLRAREDIIIKPSDKNLGLTVMNKQWYVTTALSNKFLCDTNTYIPCKQLPNIADITEELTCLCLTQTHLSKSKTDKLLKDFLVNKEFDRVKLCQMYFMPKLHKNQVGLRPVCASIGWITYWTSVYIHLSLFLFLKRNPSYITNSAQVIAMLDNIKPPLHFQFIEADIDNLYPLIDIDDGLNALYSFLKQRTSLDKDHIKFLVSLVRWVLKTNYVTFGDHTILQNSGTAMGTPCAVVFACIYVHVLEQEALDIFASTRLIFKIYLRVCSIY